MPSTRRKIAILYADYILSFAVLTAKSKGLGENFKFCMCDPNDVFNMLLK